MKYQTVFVFVLLLVIAFSVCTNAQSCSTDHNYAYLTNTGDPDNPGVWCGHWGAMGHPLLKKAPMPLNICLDKALFSGMQGSCSGSDMGVEMDIVLDFVINTINKVCNSDNLKLNKGGCESMASLRIAPQPNLTGFFSPTDDKCYTNFAATRTEYPYSLTGASITFNFTKELFLGTNWTPNNSHGYKGRCYRRWVSSGTAFQGGELDLVFIMMHEMLHALGLAHLTGLGGSGVDSYGSPCNDGANFAPAEPRTEVMYHAYGTLNYMAGHDDPLSCYNRCALTALYCPCGTEFIKMRGASSCCFEDGTQTSIENTYSSAYSPIINVFPQPTDNVLQLTLLSEYHSVAIEIYSSIGGLVETKQISWQDDKTQTSFDVSSYPSGTYYLVAIGDNGVTSTKFVVSHK